MLNVDHKLFISMCTMTISPSTLTFNRAYYKETEGLNNKPLFYKLSKATWSRWFSSWTKTRAYSWAKANLGPSQDPGQSQDLGQSQDRAKARTRAKARPARTRSLLPAQKMHLLQIPGMVQEILLNHLRLVVVVVLVQGQYPCC